jgi:teichuronic acid biosynthesis glycosyltransferase TuaG
MPLVSIILPYYKKINFFKETYKSIKNQNFKNFELIIIYDDQDLKDYYKILEIVKKNQKIKIFLNKKNLGAGLSRNFGIKKAQGKYIAFIDADDLWSKEKLKKQILFMRKNNYKFTCCNYSKKFKKNIIIDIKPKKKISYSDLIKNCQIGLSTVIIEKGLVNNKLFPNFKTQEDLAAWLKTMRLKKISCYTLGKKLVMWNYDSNSLSSNSFQKIFDAYRVFRLGEKISRLKSLIYVLRLSINSISRKIIFFNV